MDLTSTSNLLLSKRKSYDVSGIAAAIIIIISWQCLQINQFSIETHFTQSNFPFI